MPDWYEDEGFWDGTYPFMFSERMFCSAENEAGSVVDLAGLGKGDILDLACGPGRHATALAKKGFRVTGVDLSSLLLEKAKDLARAEGVNVEWLREDMRRFVRPEAFDLVMSMFTSFGYFDDRRDDITVLQNIHQNLRTGGALVMDVMSKEWLAREFTPTTSEELADGRLLVRQHEIVDDWSRVKNRWTVIDKGRAKTLSFQHAIYSGVELKDRLLKVGFTAVQLFGGLDRRAYDLDATRLVAVARK